MPNLFIPNTHPNITIGSTVQFANEQGTDVAIMASNQRIAYNTVTANEHFLPNVVENIEISPLYNKGIYKEIVFRSQEDLDSVMKPTSTIYKNIRNAFTAATGLATEETSARSNIAYKLWLVDIDSATLDNTDKAYIPVVNPNYINDVLFDTTIMQTLTLAELKTDYVLKADGLARLSDIFKTTAEQSVLHFEIEGFYYKGRNPLVYDTATELEEKYYQLLFTLILQKELQIFSSKKNVYVCSLIPITLLGTDPFLTTLVDGIREPYYDFTENNMQLIGVDNPKIMQTSDIAIVYDGTYTTNNVFSMWGSPVVTINENQEAVVGELGVSFVQYSIPTDSIPTNYVSPTTQINGRNISFRRIVKPGNISFVNITSPTSYYRSNGVYVRFEKLVAISIFNFLVNQEYNKALTNQKFTGSVNEKNIRIINKATETIFGRLLARDLNGNSRFQARLAPNPTMGDLPQVRELNATEILSNKNKYFTYETVQGRKVSTLNITDLAVIQIDDYYDRISLNFNIQA